MDSLSSAYAVNTAAAVETIATVDIEVPIAGSYVDPVFRTTSTILRAYVEVDYGDGQTARLDVPAGATVPYGHVYATAGVYTATIRTRSAISILTA